MSEENNKGTDEKPNATENPDKGRQLTISVSLAKDIGLNESLLYIYIVQRIVWIKPDMSDAYGSKYARGRWWKDIWLSSLHHEFPFFSEDILVRTIRSLEKQSCILTHNTEPGRSYVKRWYALHPMEEAHLRQSGTYVPNAPKRENPGYIYLIEGNGQYKIGKSKNIDRRTREIGLKLPFPVEIVDYMECSDMAATEAEWHARFADKRGNGEWFDLTEEDVKAFHSAVAEVERRALFEAKESVDS